jgi:NitT/TauT family transport system substrate-binding protein
MPARRTLATVASVYLLSVLTGGWCPSARAEVSELQIAKQYGISYLPLMLMEADKLVEKHAKSAGLPDIKVSWSTFASGSTMNDAILSGSLHFASGGVGPLATIWARSKGTIDVKCVTAMNVMPLYLTTRNPNVKSIKDFTEKDKIALPAVKVSIQAVTLQMAAEKEFGPGNQGKLDAFTVAMSHPDGQLALLSGAGEITGHFSSPPFQYQQLKQPGIRRVLNSYDVLGGPATFNVVWTTQKFRQENPKTYDAFLKALAEAIKAISADKRATAARYLQIANDKKSSVDDIAAMLNDPEIEFTMTPKNIMKYADFMHKTGAIKQKPESWKDLCFDNVHGLPGS